jgi:MtaA/CmuA family methyltransferase
MTSLERTLRYIQNETVDHPPCHPIVMRWAAQYAKVNYQPFCLDYQTKCKAMVRCAEDFDIDWVTVMSDPWAEAEAFGVKVDYPENDLPRDVGGHLVGMDQVRNLSAYKVEDHARLQGRICEIAEYRRLVGDRYFIVGWVEGPMAEYAALRGPSQAALDLLDDPRAVHTAMDVIVDAARAFIKAQVEAGAHCIGIGDAFASQIGPALYRDFVYGRECDLVSYIHSLGALAKLHICGNTSALLPDMIKTGADIIDIDHLVTNLPDCAELLGNTQTFCGKSDPVSVIQDGTPQAILDSVKRDFDQAQGRCIVSAGCEITPGTSVGNMKILCESGLDLPSR